MDAQHCLLNKYDWYDITSMEDARQHKKVEVCTAIDCKEDCSNSIRVFITDFNKGKAANE